MVDEERELIFIDEWSENTLEISNVKTLFQGSWMGKSVKHQDAQTFDNKAGIYLTCNELPDFSRVEQPNVDCRMSVFYTTEFPKPKCKAPQWIEDNPMEYLIWMINGINQNIKYVPQQETEDEMTSSYEFSTPLKRFKCEDSNSKEYFKEVKRIIFNNMDLCGSLSKLSILNFHTKYRKELKRNYNRADPLLDAWMTITGKQRPEFDVQIFKQNNLSVSEKTGEIRAKCGVRLCSIDREEKKSYILN